MYSNWNQVRKLVHINFLTSTCLKTVPSFQFKLHGTHSDFGRVIRWLFFLSKVLRKPSIYLAQSPSTCQSGREWQGSLINWFSMRLLFWRFFNARIYLWKWTAIKNLSLSLCVFTVTLLVEDGLELLGPWSWKLNPRFSWMPWRQASGSSGLAIMQQIFSDTSIQEFLGLCLR